MMPSASDSGTSTNEKLSAISIAPTDREVTPASPVIAPTRSPGRMPDFRAGAEEQPNHRSTIFVTVRPSPAFTLDEPGTLASRRSYPSCPSCPSYPSCTSCLPRPDNHLRNLFVLAVAGDRRVRHRHGGRRDVDDVEFLRQRFDDDPRLIVLAGEQTFAQRGAGEVELPRAKVRDGRHRRHLDFGARETARWPAADDVRAVRPA